MAASAPQLNSFALVISKYDLVVYSRAGTIGLPQAGGNVDGTELAYLTLTGTFSGTMFGMAITTGGAFYIYFFPTGSNLQAPSWNVTSAGPIRVVLEMDISELPGVIAILQNAKPGQVSYSETLSASGKVVPTGQITTVNGA